MRPAPSALRTIVPLLAIAAVMLIGPATATAAPTVDGEFTVSGVGTNNEIALGPDGNMWVTLDVGNDIARIAPDGVVTEYSSAALDTAVGIAAGPDGNIWVTKNGGVASFPPGNPAAAAFTAIADIADPRGMTAGPDGNLWTASGTKVIRIPPANPATASSFAVVTGARGITSGTDGNLWVADFGSPQVVSVTTAGAATAYPISGGSQGIAAGPDGQVAYSDPTANPQEIGRLIAGGTAQITPSPLKDPFGVAFGPDGAYWFADFAANDLGRLTTDGSYTSLTGFSAAAGPRRIAAGPAGSNTLWVTLDTADKIARVTGVDPPVVDPDPDPPTGEAPEVAIDKHPGKKVKAKSKKAKVKFRFSSPTVGAKFECSLVKREKKGKRIKGDFRSCNSPAKYKLKPGRYTFSVRASADDRTGESARTKFRVVKREKQGD